MAKSEEDRGIDYLKRDFFITTTVFKSGRGWAVTIPHKWGFRSGDIAHLHISDCTNKTIETTKKLCSQNATASSTILFIEKKWGLDISDFITLKIRLVYREGMGTLVLSKIRADFESDHKVNRPEVHEVVDHTYETEAEARELYKEIYEDLV